MRKWFATGLVVVSAFLVSGCDSNPTGPTATPGGAAAPAEAPAGIGTQKATPRKGRTAPKGLEPASAQ